MNADELIKYIADGFKIIVVAAVCIYASYSIIKILAGDLPAWIVSILIGLLSIYVVAVNTRIKDYFKK